MCVEAYFRPIYVREKKIPFISINRGGDLQFYLVGIFMLSAHQ